MVVNVLMHTDVCIDIVMSIHTVCPNWTYSVHKVFHSGQGGFICVFVPQKLSPMY